jgi:hypothetical protein
MINPSLDLFAATLIEAGRIRSGDVKRLQRDLLPDGISSRAEAELLLRLDQSVRRPDPAFSAWLVAAMVDFVVWRARPTGYVDRETAEWLARALVGHRGPTRTALLIAGEIVREAQDVDEALLSWKRDLSRAELRPGPGRASLGHMRDDARSIRASSLWRKLRGGQRPSRRRLRVQERSTLASSPGLSRSRALAQSSARAR